MLSVPSHPWSFCPCWCWRGDSLLSSLELPARRSACWPGMRTNHRAPFLILCSPPEHCKLFRSYENADRCPARIRPLSAWHWCEIFELPDLFVRPLSFMRMQPAVGSELCLILNRRKYQQRLVSVTGDEKRPKGAELWAPQIAFHLSS